MQFFVMFHNSVPDNYVGPFETEQEAIDWLAEDEALFGEADAIILPINHPAAARQNSHEQAEVNRLAKRSKKE